MQYVLYVYDNISIHVDIGVFTLTTLLARFLQSASLHRLRYVPVVLIFFSHNLYLLVFHIAKVIIIFSSTYCLPLELVLEHCLISILSRLLQLILFYFIYLTIVHFYLPYECTKQYVCNFTRHAIILNTPNFIYIPVSCLRFIIDYNFCHIKL